MISIIRIQIPAYTDAWMKGDRYGDLVKIRRSKAASGRARVLSNVRADRDGTYEIAHVKLDKSGKTIRVILADCFVY